MIVVQGQILVNLCPCPHLLSQYYGSDLKEKNPKNGGRNEARYTKSKRVVTGRALNQGYCFSYLMKVVKNYTPWSTLLELYPRMSHWTETNCNSLQLVLQHLGIPRRTCNMELQIYKSGLTFPACCHQSPTRIVEHTTAPEKLDSLAKGSSITVA